MLKVRLVTALIALAVLLLVLFMAPPLLAEFVIALLALAGAWEWAALLGLKSTWARAGIVALTAGLLLLAYQGIGSYAEDVLLAALIWWLLALAWVMFYPTPVPKVVVWIGGVFVLVPLFVALISLYRSGAAYLLFVLLIVWAADVGAYFAGKQFGKVKLAPHISPGKTWEGVFGGLFAVSLLSIAAAVWFEVNLLVLLPFCLGVACLSVVGDLTVSIFKRNAGVKDSGTLFPGHGGVLDRVDSVAAASPVFALGIVWLGLL